MNILLLDKVCKRFGPVQACKDISLTIQRGETLALVGTSGSGKSTLARCISGLYPIDSGSIRFDGTEISSMTAKQLLPLRRRYQMIFQDPYASLNPRMTVEEIVGEALEIHGLCTDNRRDRVAELLGLVSLNTDHMSRYPHEFSGGQRQRIGIARALAVEPDLLILDEPLSALDLSIQAQVANLLVDLQKQLGLSYLFIAHDLAMVRYLADRVAVMTRGEIVEKGDTETLFTSPQHPYTQQLLQSATGSR